MRLSIKAYAKMDKAYKFGMCQELSQTAYPEAEFIMTKKPISSQSTKFRITQF